MHTGSGCPQIRRISHRAARAVDAGGMTTTRSPVRQPAERIKLGSDPGQLLAALGHLIGFQPANSVVFIGHRPTKPTTIGGVLRADLPLPEHEAAQAEQLATRLVTMSDAFAATVIIIGKHANAAGQPWARLPHAAFVQLCGEALEAAGGLRVLHALWVPEIAADARWACYQDEDCSGTLPDPYSTVAAATMAARGNVTFANRDDVVALLRPDDPEIVAHRESLLEGALDELEDRLIEEVDACAGDSTDTTRAGYAQAGHTRNELTTTDGRGRRAAAVSAALRKVRAGQHILDDAEYAELGLALCDIRVRDACLATASPPGSDMAMAAEQLWITLTRGLPEPERAEPACLLGYSAYLRGEGALAGMALEAALNADPGHVLAGLLLHGLMSGLPPENLEGICSSTTGELDVIRPLSEQAGQDDPGQSATRR